MIKKENILNVKKNKTVNIYTTEEKKMYNNLAKDWRRSLLGNYKEELKCKNEIEQICEDFSFTNIKFYSKKPPHIKSWGGQRGNYFIQLCLSESVDNVKSCSVSKYVQELNKGNVSLLLFYHMGTYYCPKCNKLKAFAGINSESLSCCDIHTVTVNTSTKKNDIAIYDNINKVKDSDKETNDTKQQKGIIYVKKINNKYDADIYKVTKICKSSFAKNGYDIQCDKKVISFTNDLLSIGDELYFNNNTIVPVLTKDCFGMMINAKTKQQFLTIIEFQLLIIKRLDCVFKSSSTEYLQKGIALNLTTSQLIQYVLNNGFYKDITLEQFFDEITNDIFVFNDDGTKTKCAKLLISELLQNLLFVRQNELNLNKIKQSFEDVQIKHSVTPDNYLKIIDCIIEYNIHYRTRLWNVEYILHVFKIYHFWEELGEKFVINTMNNPMNNVSNKKINLKQLTQKELNWLINHKLIEFIMINVNENKIEYYSLLPLDFIRKTYDKKNISLSLFFDLKGKKSTKYQHFGMDDDLLIAIESLHKMNDNQLNMFLTFDVHYKLSFCDILSTAKTQKEVNNICSALKTLFIEGLNFKFFTDFVELKEECEELFPELKGREIDYKRIIIEHDYYMQRRREGTVDMTSVFDDRYIKFKPFNMFVHNKKYIVEAPREVKDLIHEGVTQKHCMDSYGQNVEAGQEMVLFVRLKRGEPLYAVSLNMDGNVVQSSGEAHSAVPGEVLAQIQREFANDKSKMDSLKHFFNCRK